MVAPGKSFGRRFALFSLGFLLASSIAAHPRTRREAADPAASAKRQAAAAQFVRAEEQRAALNAKPGEKRTLADYKQVVLSFRRVTMITPRASEAPESLLEVAEIYTEMGDRFGRSYYQSAVETYQFLVHEYPTYKYCQDAVLRTAKLQRDQLADMAQAQRTYEEFLKRYPRSPRKRDVEEALAELALLRNGEERAVAKSDAGGNPAAARNAVEEQPRLVAPVHSGGKSVAAANSSEAPRVQRIRTAIVSDATRVIIDLENSVEFTSRRITNPDRIFFDLRAARLSPEAARENIRADSGTLTAVRVAQNKAGVVRVVLDVNGVRDYTASLLSNPPQLVIDLYGNSISADPVRSASAKPSQKAVSEETKQNEAPASSGPAAGQTMIAKNSGNDATPASEQPSSTNSKGAISGAIGGSSSTNNAPASARNPTSGARGTKSKALRSAAPNAKPELVRPASTPQPTHDGQATLTRTLGLKIGRIVIDPGHGGHDTGTIGPTGLMEKDLCLDVGLRLGKIIEQRLPGAEVIYTRSDDTFIPLEQRTNIANQAKADLFISIHANSSRDSGARGIETYYLNLKGSPEAMEVAARENATAQEGVHDLQDLVKKIAQTEKIDESKEFAEDIQDSLAKRIQRSSKYFRNRGVRKAPFVVLIGADMPSILTEISFLSNPADEKLLKQPEQRQKVAEGLYQGIASYLQNLNSVTVNLPPKNVPVRGGSGAGAVEQSRNQR